ncbi:hypothetical protein [Deinococcus hopiensis]|uniref:Uncharacterized protein n=1 Tax=Deinococcus hopiensis KR-140 TaxID=695939 RepID=A0A1W1VPD3_9DEIO|nr:hypothetical protein [Deinococcus hopiensis]SMB95219.1 hypothetical protein SAMN00790413_02745 [Deinococcus hopiensis KR-140]
MLPALLLVVLPCDELGVRYGGVERGAADVLPRDELRGGVLYDGLEELDREGDERGAL